MHDPDPICPGGPARAYGITVRLSIGAVFLVLAGACAPARDGSGATGSISGVVTSAASGRPLAGICVSTISGVTVVVRDGGPRPDPNDRTAARTLNDGSYELTGLAPDEHRVIFAICEESPEAAAGAADFPEYWYDFQGDGYWDPVVVVDGDETRVDVALAPGGSIVGRVTSRKTGKPLANVCVSAGRGAPGTSREPREDEPLLSYRYEEEPVLTDKDGRYELKGLPTGAYLVTFGECYFPDEPAVVEIFEFPRSIDVESGRVADGIDARI